MHVHLYKKATEIRDYFELSPPFPLNATDVADAATKDTIVVQRAITLNNVNCTTIISI